MGSSPHPELIERRSEPWHILIVADPRRDRVDSPVRDEHQPGRPVGGHAVGPGPQAIRCDRVGRLALSGSRRGRIHRAVAEACVVVERLRWVLGAAELKCQPLDAEGASATQRVDVELWSRVRVGEDGVGRLT